MDAFERLQVDDGAAPEESGQRSGGQVGHLEKPLALVRFG